MINDNEFTLIFKIEISISNKVVFMQWSVKRGFIFYKSFNDFAIIITLASL